MTIDPVTLFKLIDATKVMGEVNNRNISSRERQAIIEACKVHLKQDHDDSPQEMLAIATTAIEVEEILRDPKLAFCPAQRVLVLALAIDIIIAREIHKHEPGDPIPSDHSKLIIRPDPPLTTTN